ncbi:DUF885 family protein [Limnohabitans sp. 2KL-51]|jgi:uncharacterized protein (DUF885 family)|uniref:DUF885 domain-containing protein n=1 Tax=Limnohabitans sp. 2KL-51 TaxID=1977911 RepID=UPI001304A150|nr:DUF885 domain-containing protein [Limnohabitans sp. 2KL-51]
MAEEVTAIEAIGEAGLALNELSSRYWQFLRYEFPLNALTAGEPLDEPTLFREAPSDFARRADVARIFHAELGNISLASLSQKDRITYRLLERELTDLQDLFATGSHLRPWLLPAGPEFNTQYFANLTHLGDVAQAKLYLARLATLSDYFRDVQACLDEGVALGIRAPKVVLAAAAANLKQSAQGDASRTAWCAPFGRSPMASQATMMGLAQDAARIVAEQIQPALQNLADHIEHRLLPNGRESVACTEGPLGVEFYAFWVRHFTNLPMTPDAVHTIGLEQVSRLEEEMTQVAARSGVGGDLDSYRRFLAEDPGFRETSAERLRERVEALAKRIDGKIPSILGHLPRSTYGVQSIPASASEKLPMAYAQPNPADGSAPGTFWINGLPDRVPTYSLVSVTLHEAWPGHLMHIALMQEMTALPMFRRANFTKYGACLEGWAMYCETLGHELGLYETPHQHFGQLDMEMWRACRLVVDTGLHAKGWTREQAVQYMVERLSLSRNAIEAEVDRYIAMPAQALAYHLGGLKFRELRTRAQSRLGERFNLLQYHDQLMAAGAVTLPVLEEIIDTWLDGHAT